MSEYEYKTTPHIGSGYVISKFGGLSLTPDQVINLLNEAQDSKEEQLQPPQDKYALFDEVSNKRAELRELELKTRRLLGLLTTDDFIVEIYDRSLCIKDLVYDMYIANIRIDYDDDIEVAIDRINKMCGFVQYYKDLRDE